MLEGYLQNKMTTVEIPAISARARCRRVMLLLLLVIILSIGDLAATIINLQSIGMLEINPLAAFIIRYSSTYGLIIYKLGSVMFSISIILLVRHRWQGELAAWIAALILIGLTVYWFNYTSFILEFNDTISLSEAQSIAGWIQTSN